MATEKIETDFMRLYREKAGMTQEELGRKVGITRQGVSLIETGINKPKVDIAKKIGELLHFDWTLFYER